MTLFSRNGKVVDYPEARDAVRNLGAERAVIDCEIITMDKKGKSSFAAPGVKPWRLHDASLCIRSASPGRDGT